MFAFSDPGETLPSVEALQNYRALLETEYQTSSRLPDSAFTLLEVFDGVGDGRRRRKTMTVASASRFAVSKCDVA